MRLRYKLLLLFILVGAGTLILTGALLTTQLNESRLSILSQSISLQIGHLDFAVTNLIQETMNDVKALAATPAVLNPDHSAFTNFLEADEKTFTYRISGPEQAIIDIFNTYRKTHPYANSVYMGRENGSFVRSHKRKRPTRYDPRVRPWYRLGRKNLGTVAKTSPYSSVTSADINIALVTGLRNPAGEFMGVVGVDITLAGLTRYISNVWLGRQGYLVLIDETGTVIATKEESWRFKPLKALLPESYKTIAYNSEGHLLITLDSTEYRMFFRTSPGTGWKMAALIPESEISGEISRFAVNILTTLFLGLALLCFLAYLGLHRFVIRPLRVLNAGTRELDWSQENDQRVEIDSGDELGELAGSFNEMVDRLRTSRTELEAYQTQLEELVRERTTELEEKNNALSEEITQRALIEEARRESEERHRSLLEMMPDAVVVYLEGQITFANRAAAGMLGAGSVEELIGRKVWEIVHQDDHHLVQERIDRLSKTDRLPLVEMRHVRLDGRIVETEVIGRAFSYEGRKAVLSLWRDITDRKEAERELQLQQTYLEQLFETAPEALALIDKNDRVVKINDEFVRIFGFPAEEVIGRSLDDTIIPKESRSEGKRFRKRITEGRMELTEVRRRRKDGSYINVSVTGTVIRVNSEVQGVYAIYRDITERKEAEAALKESEEKYRLLVEHAWEGIGVAQDGMFKWVNPRMAEIMGHPEGELIARPLTEFIHPDDRELVGDRHVRRLKGEKLPNVYSFRIITEDGRVRILEISVVVFVWEDRPATLCFFKDITERQQAEEKLMRNLDELERFNNLTVGREEKMIRLKDEVNGLLIELGRAKKYKVVE